ncbi:hypothetical protein AGABI1DRAFT_53243 [Agaricus bisporus var. burnettii JB137-S8]|uniref:JmjC domain-containing protein n=1 Tax=Agaricus bisporus var. burnettii (strain JB137-S8 / ATCC MYA-4627 / FGSC 10392) TaxID=597362 RepID=K5Y447_AGABU|nr:uncharacterized protein AGABI1DRAFT_53243 [Agaricus bisporus var. burnettii JB137-S8]EKM82780.1 hypothetical protein AGABI1DRAFT_53243 [Agaricus bisporus var. burnettii JB137-S8]
MANEFLTLSDIAYEKMRLAPSTTLTVWQILYADACILHALCILNKPNATRSIGTLDKAIIIAGGGDENRLDLILSCINKIQQIFFPTLVLSRKLLHQGHHPSPNLLSTAHHEVPTIDTEPSFLSFQEIHSKGPFVIRDYARDWPALKDHKWNSIDYLLSVSGSSRTIPIEVGHDYRDEDWSQTLMGWEDFLDVIREKVAGDSSFKVAKILYLAQYNLLRQFPSLRNDIAIPDYVYCALSSQDFPEYTALRHGDNAILNAWLGPEGATSPAHFDPYYNLYVQIVGYKTVWLSPPNTKPYMEALTLLKRSEDIQTSLSERNSDSLNTSRIDVFNSKETTCNFSDFREKVVPEAMSVVLGPGDLLFFPPGWWHGMRSESTCFSVSMWF